MSKIIWTPEYSVGVEEFDNQHKKLIDLINQLDELYIQNKFDQIDVSPIFKELMDYASQHLEAEEHYFKLYNYAQKDEHVSLHNSYRQKILDLQLEYEKASSKETLFKINNFLNEWWTWHINNVDKEYTEFFHANGLY